MFPEAFSGVARREKELEMKLAIARNGMGSRLGGRTLALGLATSMVAPGLMAGCGGGGNNQQASAPPPPPAMQPRMQPVQPRMQPQQHQGMTRGQKFLLIGGAALAYYLWKKHKNAQNQPLPQGVQMYQSKNGGIYYRDPQTHAPVYVVPPTSGPQAKPFTQQMQVDPAEAQGLNLQQYQGYSGATSGTGLDAVRQMLPQQ